ncbi:MAG TPA: tetratricopeptide repeat protein, partial [Lacipirellulaceae bacterium]|nr:tetratricopeptide repeat protein [Lacipirellulaceae bacterium]
MRLGRYEQCDALLADLLRESPDDPSIHFRAAQLDLRRGHPAEALARLAPMREQPAYADAIDCLAGQAHLLLQQWDSAEEAFRRVLAGDEDNAEAYAGLATIALQRGEFQEAAELAIQAVGLHHHLPSAHMTLGLALAECQCEAEAIHALETALGMAPDLHLAHRKLAQLRRAQGVGPA